jgi:vacuolar-type H+-ATPase subunit C/Vma6
VSRIQKYANVQVKIGYERGELLSKAKMEELAAIKSLADAVNNLKQTMYGDELARISLPFTVMKVERAFRQNFLEALFKIVKNSPKSTMGFLRNLVIWFEYENVKNILRAVNTRFELEELPSRVFFSVEDFLHHRELFEKALAVIDVPSAVGILKDVANKPPLALGIKQFEETGSTRFFEFLLDKSYYENLAYDFEGLPKRERKSASFYAETEVDGFMINTVLRGKLFGYDLQTLRVIIPQRYFRLSNNDVEALLESSSFEDALKIVLGTPYGRFLVKREGNYETITSFGKNLEMAIFGYASKRRIAEAFNVGAPLSFIEQKRVEVHNLVKLSLGLEYGLKPEKIVDSLTFPS